MKTLLMLLAFFAASQPLGATIYKGTIGKYTVYADLTVSAFETGTEIYGVYFYESQCHDIPMEGKLIGSKYVINAGVAINDPEYQEHFTLVKVGKSLNGSWEYKGKKLDVVLREFNPADIGNKYMRNPFVLEKSLSEIEQIRTSYAVFEKTDSVTPLENGFELTWYKEKHWDSYLFRVTKGLPAETMQWVNDFLEAEQLSSFNGYAACTSPFGWGEFSSGIHNCFINEDFLSYEESVGYDCGGAHPDFSTIQFNLSLKDKQLLRAEDLLHFPGVVKRTDHNFDEWSAYRSDVFAVRIMEYLSMEHPDEFPAEQEGTEEGEEELGYYDEEDCDYSDPNVWEFSEVLITPEGLKFGAYFYRYMRHCDDPEWAVIPYEVLKEYLNPEYRAALMKLTK